MVAGYYKLIIGELGRLGYTKKGNTKGSHEKWVDQAGKVMIVPHNLKSRHTANAILKDAGSAEKI